jgi:hypothetical protein
VTAFDRAQEDLAAGRAWKARVRLEGALAADPADQRVLELLAEVCFQMQDLPAAGKYWFLTGAIGEDVEAAIKAFDERYPTPRAKLLALPLSAPAEQFPRAARARLGHLLADGDAKDLWSRKKGYLDPRFDFESGVNRRARLIAAAIAIGALLVFLVGAVTVVVLLLRALASLA